MSRKPKVPLWVFEDPPTGLKLLWKWCLEAGSGHLRPAAKKLGWSAGRLSRYLHDPEYGLKGPAAVELSRATGIPTDAIIFKHTPISELTKPQGPAAE